MRSRLLLIVSFVAILAACSQSSEPVREAPAPLPAEPSAEQADFVRLVEDDDVEEVETAEVELDDTPAATIVYISNDVSVRTSSGMVPAELAMQLVAGDRIVVGPRSFCEVHVGARARLMLEENTTVTIRDIASAGAGETRLAQETGAVLSRVARLTGNERFSVQTPSLVAGVRGTEFSTTIDEEGAVAVAVAEGTVAVRDVVPEVDERQPETEGERGVFARLRSALDDAAVAVEAGSEVELRADGASPVALPADIAERLEDEEVASAVVEEVRSAAAATVPERIPRPATPQRLEQLRRLEAAVDIDLGAQAARPADPEVVSLSVETEPPGALVSFEPRPAAPAPVSQLFAHGASVQVRVSAPGYRERVIRLVLSEPRGRSLRVPLERLDSPGDEPEQPDPEPEEADSTAAEPAVAAPPVSEPDPEATATAPARREAAPVEPEPEPVPEPAVVETPPEEPEPEPEPATRRVRIRATPEDARVSVVGETQFTGSGVVELTEGERYTIRATRANYETAERVVTVSARGPDAVELRLEPIDVIWSRSVASGALVRSLAADGGLVAWASADGAFGVVDRSGRVLWSLETANTPNENSPPVIDARAVYFSGASELVIADRRSGEVLERRSLSGADAHIFGRTVTPLPDGYAYPTNAGIRIVRGGSVTAELDVPQGSTMSAAVVDDALLIAGNAGALVGYPIDGGAPLYRIETGVVQPVAHRPVAWGDVVYLVGRRGRLVAVDVAQRRVAWTATLPTGTFTEPAVSPDGVYVFAGGSIHGFDHDGTRLFEPVGSSSPPAAAGGRLFHGDDSLSLMVRDAATGRPQGTLDLGAPVTARPIVSGEQVLVGLRDGRVLAAHRAAIR